MEKPDILLPARCVPGQHAGDWGVKLVRPASSPIDAAGSEASIEYVYVLFPVSTCQPNLLGKYGNVECSHCPSIVAVHGLNGHWERSWTSSSSGRNWLSDLLPDDIPSARILSYGYNVRTHGGKGGSNVEFFHEHAEDFLAKLQEFRERTKVSPMLFVTMEISSKNN